MKKLTLRNMVAILFLILYMAGMIALILRGGM